MSFVSTEDLAEEFESFGFELNSAGEIVIEKLKDLCSIHRLEPGDLASEWVAFIHSKKTTSDVISGELLDIFERERLSKKNKPAKATHIKKEPGKVIYNLETLPGVVDEDPLLDTYSTPSSKFGLQKKRQLTPENLPIKRLTGKGRSPAVVPFSPASFSPADATPSRKYGTRTSAGDVVVSYGSTEKVNWLRTNEITPNIVAYDTSTALNKPFKYMFQKLVDKGHVLNDAIEEMAAYLQKHHNIEEFSHVALPIQEEITVAGRICCDSNGKLNAKSVVLEGSRETSAGKCIPLDLTELKEYSLFPGQVVAMEGINITGQKFIAKQLHKGVPPAEPEAVLKTESASPIHVMVAVGPFTTSDNMSYEPLADLFKYLQRDKPHVLILMGPFVDAKNEEIEKGTLKCTFDEVFQRHLEEISIMTQRIQCEVVIVPSQRDVHHDFVYPQPPFKMDALAAKYKHVHFVSDPSTLMVDSTIIGLTSTDILFHLGAEEISGPPGSSDRLGRLTRHLLTQHSFYPLYPPSEEVNIDYDQFEIHAKLSVIPHILLLPSDLRFFMKDIDGCCCVNPGRLTKGLTGGTYGRLMIQPSNHGTGGVEIVGQVVKV